MYLISNQYFNVSIDGNCCFSSGLIFKAASGELRAKTVKNMLNAPLTRLPIDMV